MSDFNRPHPGKSTADALMRVGFKRMSDMDRKQTIRSIFVRGRWLESKVEWNQLPLRSSRTIVSPEGSFYFIVGLSRVGGADVVRS